MFSTIGTMLQKGVQAGVNVVKQGAQAGVSAIAQAGVSAIKYNFELLQSNIGEKPTDEEIVEMVKNALNKKLRDKEKEFIYLLKDEFFTWLREKYPERPRLISTVEPFINAIIVGLKQVKFFVDIEKGESIVNEETNAIIKKKEITGKITEGEMYQHTDAIIKKIAVDALIPTDESDFEDKKQKYIKKLEQVMKTHVKRINSGGSAASGGGGGGGGGNARARRRGLKSRRRNRKQRKTRKQK